MKKGLTLKDRILRYIQRQAPKFVSSGEIQRMVVQYTKYTPRTAVRRLQELCNEAAIRVEYRKGHAWYTVNEFKPLVVVDDVGEITEEEWERIYQAL